MKTTQENRIEMTEDQVLAFLQDLFMFGNATVSCSIGNGGAGLDISLKDLTQSLVGMTFDGQVAPCSDFETWADYNSDDYTPYQWSDDRGFKIQVLVW